MTAKHILIILTFFALGCWIFQWSYSEGLNRGAQSFSFQRLVESGNLYINNPNSSTAAVLFLDSAIRHTLRFPKSAAKWIKPSVFRQAWERYHDVFIASYKDSTVYDASNDRISVWLDQHGKITVRIELIDADVFSHKISNGMPGTEAFEQMGQLIFKFIDTESLSGK